MKNLHAIVILLLLIALPVGTLAQADDAPLFMIINNYLWSWTPGSDAPPQKVIEPFVDDMVISPDGTQLAIIGMADITLDAINRTGGIGGGGTPSDIWLLNTSSGAIQHIGQQPAGASFLTQGVEDNAVSRSAPVWSPDGTQLSWAEQVIPELKDQIVIYDIASSRIETTITDIPAQIGIPTPLELTWGEAGILYRSWSLNADGNEEEALILHAPDGTLISTILLDMTRPVSDYGFVSIDNQPFIEIAYSDDTREVINPYTLSSQPLTALPYLYSVLAPDALRLSFERIEESDRVWRATSQEGANVAEGDGRRPDLVALSPNGQAIAFSIVSEDIVQIWRDGQTLTVPEIRDQYSVRKIVWGPVARRAEQDVSELLAGLNICPGVLPSRLTVGEQARVLGSSANNVRSEPAASSDLLGQIPGKAVFTVIDGPVCADDLAWWQVDHEGLIGWTAEGIENTYWIEPIR